MNHARPRGHRVHAALYDRMTGPLKEGVLGTRRSALLAGLPGEILDVGAETGANLPHFRSASRVTAAEPDPAMRRRMAAKLPGTPVPVQQVTRQARRKSCLDSQAQRCRLTHLVVGTSADASSVLRRLGPIGACSSPGRKPG